MDIIPDMGNVLLEWDKDKILQGISDTKKDYLMLDKTIFQSGLWERLDLGTMTREELVLKVVSMIGTDLATLIFIRKSFLSCQN